MQQEGRENIELDKINSHSMSVEVKASTIPNAGFGLFAKKRFFIDERVALYGGVMKRTCEEQPSGEYVYLFPEELLSGRMTETQIVKADWRGTYRDTSVVYKPNEFGRWMNHSNEARNVFADIEGIEEGAWVLSFFAMRNIEIGEEIFFDYGPLFQIN
jgi:hypothetical protein